jgi:hypothetical protein
MRKGLEAKARTVAAHFAELQEAVAQVERLDEPLARGADDGNSKLDLMAIRINGRHPTNLRQSE